MAFIEISNIDFNASYSTVQTVTVAFKLASDPDIPGSYTIATTTLQINPDDSVVGGPFYITGLVLGEIYTVRISNNCNGITYQKSVSAGIAPTTTTTTTTIPPTTTTSTTTSTSSSSSSTTTTSTTLGCPQIIDFNKCYIVDDDGAYIVDGDGAYITTECLN